MRKILLISGLLLLLAVPAWADLADLKTGFMDIAWGSALPEQINGEKEQIGDMLVVKQQNVELGGLKVDEVQLFFYNNQFTQAMVLHQDVDALYTAFSSLYGPPEVEDNPMAPGMKNWRVDAEGQNFISVGILPDRKVAAVVHTGYLMQMLEGVSGK